MLLEYCAIFENLSTTTIILSYSFEVGRGLMKSKLMISHEFWGTSLVGSVFFDDLTLFTSKHILDVDDYTRPPVVSYDKFICFGIAWVSSQLMILNYLFSKNS